MGFAYKITDQQGLYYITATVTQWVDVFSRACYADILIDSLEFCKKNKGLQIYAWVIMSNHLHMICSCADGYDLSDTLRDFKKFTATVIVDAIRSNKSESRKNWLLWLLEQNGAIHFWQEGNHPEEIITHKFFEQKLNYIHMNPVRAGIADRPEDYRYSSARDYCNIKGLIGLAYQF
ncbi:MAG: transposase [Bacteroidota bacterium]